MPQNDDIIEGVTNNGDEDFDAAFAEAASALDKSPAPAADTDENTDAAPNTDQSQPDATASGNNEAAASETPPAESVDDIWANAPENLKAAYQAALQKSEHTIKSLKGRLSASDRRWKEIQEQQQAGASRSQSNENNGDDLPEDVARFREEYSEIADPIEKLIDQRLTSKLGNNNGSNQTAASQYSQSEIEAALNQAAILETVHPDWRELDSEAYGNWLNGQPRYIQEAAVRNSELIVDADEIADILTRFKSETKQASSPSPKVIPQPDPRRAQQIEGARSVRPSPAPQVAAGVPDDFDAAFETYAKKVDAKRMGSRTR